jgi:hypothetical protein
MKEWLLNNGYVLEDGIYINYDKAIKVIFNDYNYPFVCSLHGFYTKDYFELSMVIAKYYPIEL